MATRIRSDAPFHAVVPSGTALLPIQSSAVAGVNGVSEIALAHGFVECPFALTEKREKRS